MPASAPQKVTVNCMAWGARQLFDEARELQAKADAATETGDESAAAAFARSAEGCRVAGRNALIEAGLPDDEEIEPETWTPLTDEEIVQRERDAEEGVRIAWAMLRAQRDALLAKADWTELPSRRAAMDASTRAAWDDYRQALRDLPAGTTDPQDPQWPGAPA